MVGEVSAVPWGPLFFVVGLFLIIVGPLMGALAARNGNILGAVMWWMLGVPLGVGFILMKM